MLKAFTIGLEYFWLRQEAQEVTLCVCVCVCVSVSVCDIMYSSLCQSGKNFVLFFNKTMVCYSPNLDTSKQNRTLNNMSQCQWCHYIK